MIEVDYYYLAIYYKLNKLNKKQRYVSTLQAVS